jgi:5-formyltetrahydrofolate cyclo-ligase
MLDRAAGTEPALTGAALREAKLSLRTRMIGARDALDPAYRAWAAQRISAGLQALPSFATARVALDAGKTLALPRVNAQTRMLELHAIGDPAHDVAPGYHGIPEPRSSLPRVDAATVDWVLVPGVAFSPEGRRLGYGGGFYDRLMATLRPSTARIAGAFDVQIAAHIPAASHDLAVERVITESRILRASDRG